MQYAQRGSVLANHIKCRFQGVLGAQSPLQLCYWDRKLDLRMYFRV